MRLRHADLAVVDAEADAEVRIEVRHLLLGGGQRLRHGLGDLALRHVHAIGAQRARHRVDGGEVRAGGDVQRRSVERSVERPDGIAAQPEGLAGAADVRRLKIGALDEHVLRRLVDLRVLPAHDAG